MDFLHTRKRRPSKYKTQERSLVNWYKHNRKQENKGEMFEERKEWFHKLKKEAAKYQRVNQHAYVNPIKEGILDF